MDGAELLPVAIAEALGRGATVVTGNQRAARTLRRAFDRNNRELGLKSWQPPAVLAWDAWTARLWQGLLVDGHASQLLLNRMQEHAVWQGILEDDAELRSLRARDSLAGMAAEAWRRLCSYNGKGSLRGVAVSSDTRAFQRWALAFQRRCRNEGFLSHAEIEDALRTAVEAGRVQLATGEIVLVGFDGMTPAQTGLVDAVGNSGCLIDELRLAVPGEARLLVGAVDEQEEFFAAARWLRKFVDGQPHARVAVIVPALEKQRAEIDRVFREVLAPELENIEARSNTGPYEFSLGVKLAETPMGAAALALLHWATEPLPLEQVSWLLLSPYFAMAPGDQHARAEFDAFELRKSKRMRPEVSLDWLIHAVEGSKRRLKLGRLRGVLRSMRMVAANRLEGADRRSHAEWAARMRELLDAAGWGAGVVESSVEFQTRAKWESALDELATLDFDGERVGFVRALESLERIARQTMFAPESREAPVQVMGPLEAAGATFDAVWFLQAGDLAWPVVTSGTPLLPWQLQRELGMPGADVTRDSEHARRITERIADSAGTVVFSYAKESVEGKQRPSPLLEGLHLEEIGVAELAGVAREHATVAVETIADVASVQALPDRVIRGGARILELQAACGFRAFAEHRLWATELEPAELGMDARERGTVVHQVLEYFWDEVKTQSALMAMSQVERAGLLDVCIMRGLRKASELSETQWDEAYVEVQWARLRRLLGPWLELELARPSFEVKLSEKKLDDVKIGPLRLNVRVDRVDLVEGGELLIDYKTGIATPNDWLTDRPDAPQLPLYAVLSEAEQLQGVAFGLVRAGEGLGLKGYAAADGVLPHAAKLKVPSLEAQVDDWRRVLVDLATEFDSGVARVAPKKYPATCDRCGQRILCRLDASLLEEEDDETAAEVSRG